MKLVYPIVLTPVKGDFEGYAVAVPDLDIHTQGINIADAISMARDAIGMWICYEQDQNRTIPEPSDMASVEAKPGEIVTLVDVDINEYRRTHDDEAVPKSLVMPVGEEYVLLRRDALQQALEIYSLKPELLHESDGSITIALDELLIYVNGQSKEEALSDLVNELRIYLKDYCKDFELYVNSPNRRQHLPYILQLSLCKTDDDIKTLLEM